MNEHTDTRLTDYALGELTETEQRQVEALLKDNVAARGEVEELQRLGKLLHDAALPAANAAGAVAVAAFGNSLRAEVERRLAAQAGVALPAVRVEHSWLRSHWKAVAAGGMGVLAASVALMIAGSGEFRRGAASPDSLGAEVLLAQREPNASAMAADDLSSRSFEIGSGSWEVKQDHKFDSRNVPSIDLSGNNSFHKLAAPLRQPTPIPPDGSQAFDPKLATVQIGNLTTPSSSSSTALTRTMTVTAGTTSQVAASSPKPGNPPSAVAHTKVGAGTLTLAGAATFSGVLDPSSRPVAAPSPIIANPVPTASLGAITRGDDTSPLLLEHQQKLAKYGPNHPKVREVELRIKAVTEHGRNPSSVTELELKTKDVTEHLDAGLIAAGERRRRWIVKNRGFDAANGPWDVDHDGDGVADTIWVELGRPVTPVEQIKFQELADLMSSTIQPETWREVKTVEQLQKRLEGLPSYRQFQERVEKAKQENGNFNTEAYDALVENPFLRTGEVPLSTFSIDVDTASYANVRRFLNSGELPPPDAVRLEEFVNYFTYDYPQPKGEDPFSVTTEAARCPWNGDHVLVRVGLKGREIHRKERPATNLVFLVDVSGSMQDQNKLPLVRESLKMLVRELGDSDRVAIVVYAGSSGLVLAPTGGDRKQTILEAIDRLEAGGSTNGAEGIQLAYQLAAEYFIKGGANRVVLATDGDFNVGITDQGELVRLIEEKAKTGVFFSALGYGMGNLKDSTLEKLADKGNGNYAYIDSLAEARKVLVEQMSGTLVTIAKDVKIQIEFNPNRVAAYRLLGYENRILAAQDFNDDKKDAGEIGAGHTVTALYELIPAGKAGTKEITPLPAVDPLKYQQSKQENELTDAAATKELLTLKLRYKQPDGDKSKLLEQPLRDEVQPYAKASDDLKFSSSVAAFGMLLRHSKYRGSATFDAVLELAQAGMGSDQGGYRKEFLELVRKAKDLTKQP